jgi:glucose-6-phosphate dehydrogenase assembly protein OpcA
VTATAVVRVPLDKIEKELARLWEEEAKATASSRVTLLTIVALVSEPELLERAKAVLADVVGFHPSRTIAVVWTDSDSPSIDAEVALHAHPAHANAAAGDAIVLEARGMARDWLPETIDKLILSGLPSCVWWVGDLPDGDDLFDRMVGRADVAVVNSGEMDLRDLEKLSQLAVASHKTRTALTDLTWVRLRAVQDLVARFFDDPALRPHLDTLRRVTVGYAPGRSGQDVTSPQAGLLVGWLAAALGIKSDTATWLRSTGGGGVVTLAYGGRALEVDFVCEPRPDVTDGAITRIALDSEAGTTKAHFEIVRLEDPQTFRWSGEATGAVVPSQTLRIARHEEAKLLTRLLERPTRDPLFEASLSAGFKIVRPIAPRLSERPPRSS